MKTITNFHITPLIVSILILFSVSAKAVPLITWDPLNSTHAVDTVFDLTLIGTGFVSGLDTTAGIGASTTGSAGGSVTIDWDPNVLDLMSVDYDVFNPGFDFAGSAIINNTLGTADITVFPFFANLNDFFDIAVLTFQAASSAGVTPTDITVATAINWADSSDKNYITQPSVVNGSVTVSAVPLPPALLLFGSGLLGMVSIGRRKLNNAVV